MKETRSSNIYHGCEEAKIIQVGLDEVHFTHFEDLRPCMAATDLNGAFVVVIVSAQAGLMGQIAPPSLEDSDQSTGMKHVEEMMYSVKKAYLIHREYFDTKDTYAVVAYANKDGRTAQPEELEYIKDTLRKRMQVRTASYDARIPNSALNQRVFLDARKEQADGRNVKWPIVWVGNGIVDEAVESA